MWKLTLGIHGMPPRTMSSILGWVAAVMAMVSPSHPRPAVIHRTSISAMGGAGWVELATDLQCNRAPRGSGAGTIFHPKVDLGKGEWRRDVRVVVWRRPLGSYFLGGEIWIGLMVPSLLYSSWTTHTRRS